MAEPSLPLAFLGCDRERAWIDVRCVHELAAKWAWSVEINFRFRHIARSRLTRIVLHNGVYFRWTWCGPSEILPRWSENGATAGGWQAEVARSHRRCLHVG